MTTAAAPALRAPSPQPPGGSRRVDDPARSGALAPDAERSGGGQDGQHAGRATCGSCAEWRGPLCRPTAPGWRRATWAVTRKWETGDDRAHRLIRSKIRIESDYFGYGTKHYY